MRTIGLLFFVILWISSQAFAAIPRYLEVSFSRRTENQKPVIDARLAYDVTDFGERTGVFYISNTSSGVKSGLSPADEELPDFELLFALRLTLDKTENVWAKGLAISANYADGTRIESGSRIVINQRLTVDESSPVGSAKTTTGQEIFMYVTALAEAPRMSESEPDFAIKLVSTQRLNGREYSKAVNTKSSFGLETRFNAEFSLPSENKLEPLQTRYAVVIKKIPPVGVENPEPNKFMISFSRVFQVYSVSGKTVIPVATKGFGRGSQVLTLEPGKEIRLVFPSEEPAFRGFDIEDTLIILPKK
ncbi:MAG: hypothetical protein WBP29_12245 [Candidatus Zixiibacteriota bacterium]